MSGGFFLNKVQQVWVSSSTMKYEQGQDQDAG